MALFASDPSPRATSEQLRYIDSLLEKTGLDEGYVWEVVDHDGESLKNLTVAEASMVIEALLDEVN
jgi:hypothetical protein